MGSLLFAAPVLVFPAAVAYAAVSDLLTMTIPNRLSLLLLAAFWPAAFMAGLDAWTIGMHALVGAAVLAVTFACFAMGWIGGGDAKLAPVVALWMGTGLSLEFLVYMALVGGAMSWAFLAFRAVPLPVFAAKQEWVARLHQKGNGVPYGIAIAAGALLTFPKTVWFPALATLLHG